MQLNYRKTIVDQIDEAVAKATRSIESITLTKEERAEFYRAAYADGRFSHRRSVHHPKLRGTFRLLNGRTVEVLAA